MKLSYILIILFLALMCEAAPTEEIQGSSTLILATGEGNIPDLIEPGWTADDSILDLDIVGVSPLANESVLVLGRTTYDDGQAAVLVRYLSSSNNEPDRTFGHNGVVYLTTPKGDFYVDKFVVTHEGTILVGGLSCLKENGACSRTSAQLSIDGVPLQISN
jgi:hypothetical protein